MRQWIRENKIVFYSGIALVAIVALIIVLTNMRGNTPSSNTEQTLTQSEVVAAMSTPTDTEATGENAAVKVVPITEYLDLLYDVNKFNVAEATMNSTSMNTAAMFTDTKAQETVYVARYLSEQTDDLLEAYNAAGAPVTVTGTGATRIVNGVRYPMAGPYPASSGGLGFFPMLLLGTLIAGVVFLAFRMYRTSKMQAAAAESQNLASVPSTRFTDVAGCDEAIEDLQELVLFLKEPERFTRTGAVPPSGALLVGPPGTGKTLLARAVAGEAGVPFYAASGSDFVEMYVGVGAKRVRSLFQRAKKHPEGAIVFIDEIDAIGKKRSSNANASNQEHDQTLNALLVEMDGFHGSNVIVLGATNRDDMLDAALLRPGRLDHKVSVGLPDRLGREKILAVHAQNKPLADDVDLDHMARRTPGMSGAELAKLVNEACLHAARADRDKVTPEDFDDALATVAMGKARLSAIVTPHDRLVTAWHEAGHTVCAMVLPEADSAVSVSIIPRGPAGGVTWMSQGDDLFLTRKRAFARLVVAMGGRAAEEMLLDGEFTSGPHGDLTSATQTALAMVTKFGMTEAGLMIRDEGWLSTGSKITDETVEAVEALLAEALETARTTLSTHRHLLEMVVDGLLDKDTLGPVELAEIFETAEVTPPMLPPAPTDYRRNVPVAPVVDAPEPVAVPVVEPVVSREGKKDRQRTHGRRLADAFHAAVAGWRGSGKRIPG